ncbi:FAD-binding protein [Paracoccus tegillarcae]|uniref:FAD-binding protein n=1 Tax=Paracoccus tegillarcae TaxID=1529068 RepID=A0A2K9ERG9_9RHOB|nr:FAD-binding protein [Paracoccus tegillarcae]AUH33376.1 FAD-binding protein [Paracoccus tegillarcae]
MGRFTRRALLLGTGAIIGAYAANRLAPWHDTSHGVAQIGETPAGWLNDASLLSPTPVAKHIVLSEDPGEALIARLRAELAEARQAGRPLCLSAARHSMGGQSLPRDGTALGWDNGQIEIDSAAQTYLAPGNARWSQIIAALDPVGMSPKVMQSNNDFGLAATFSVNAHGWPVPHGPMGSTVRGLTMMLPDGEVVTCSRDENADLFGMAMGGYGLIGLILTMEVEAAPNMRITPGFERMPGEGLADAFLAALDDPAVGMAYGRLSVQRAEFLDQGLMIAYRPDEDQSDLPPASGSGWVSRVAAHIYRAQLYREPAKRLRWWTEASLNPRLGGTSTRNSLMNEPVVTLDDGDPTRTDILHEYFVPADRWADFIAVCKQAIPPSYQEMLNVTIRYVAADKDSWLAYAPTPRLAAVMSFSQEMSDRSEADMARMTREMIDGMDRIGGSYYLPYRPHATVEQFATIYPRAAGFAAAKRQLDPRLTLRNALWDTYLEPL